MIKAEYLIALGFSATAGALWGIFTNRKNPRIGSLLGAAAGIAAAAIVANGCKRLRERSDDGIDYYSETSPLYQEFDDIEV